MKSSKMSTVYINKQFADGGTYEGEALAGEDGSHRPHGQGRRTWPSGDQYTGSWQEGRRHGDGVLRRQGREIRGVFSHDLAPRRGILVYADQRIYSGDLEAERPHGHGRLTWPGGQRTYIGDFVEGRRLGFGEMRAPTLVYRGLWSDDLPNDPRGTLEYSNGDIYVGEVVRGRAHGLGEQRMAADGRRLRGNFSDGASATSGTLTWPGQRCWQGPIRAGLPFGRGTMTYTDGWSLHGSLWGAVTPSSGVVKHAGPPAVHFVGALVDGRPCGEGTSTWPNDGISARVVVDSSTNWGHLFQRERLSAQVAALCDTRGNSLRGRKIFRLPCGHVDSCQHLESMQKIAAGHRRRAKHASAQMSLRCGISTCRRSLAEALASPGVIDLPGAVDLERFFEALDAHLPGDVQASDPAAASAFLARLAASGLTVPTANATEADKVSPA